jgi:hypothetical protein
LIVAPIRNVETSADAGRTAVRPQPEGIRIATTGVTGRCSYGITFVQMAIGNFSTLGKGISVTSSTSATGHRSPSQFQH